MTRRTKRYARAVRAVDELGIALVYPIANRPEPPSLWSALHPNQTMSWTWDDGADGRVVDLWHLRAQLAEGRDVAYGKWFRGRATLFSLPVFHAMLGRIAAAGDPFAGLPPEAHEVLALLRERSPLSTKELRAQGDLRGKAKERLFTGAMKVLWSRLLVAGVGEIEDGAFPSLAVGATELLFEDLWTARGAVPAASERRLEAALRRSRAFAREHANVLADVREASVKSRVPRARGRAGVLAWKDL